MSSSSRLVLEVGSFLRIEMFPFAKNVVVVCDLAKKSLVELFCLKILTFFDGSPMLVIKSLGILDFDILIESELS